MLMLENIILILQILEVKEEEATVEVMEDTIEDTEDKIKLMMLGDSIDKIMTMIDKQKDLGGE
jgi:hypothetical protein